METTLKVLQVSETVQRAYVSKNGEQKTILSRNMILSNGLDTMFCEQTGPAALQPLVSGGIYRVQFQIKYHKWIAQDNTERYQTDISIIKMEQALC